MGGKKGNKSKKSKTKTAVQKAAEARHAKFKQTRVQTFGGKRSSFSKSEESRIKKAGYSVKGYSKAAPNKASGYSGTSGVSVGSRIKNPNPKTTGVGPVADGKEYAKMLKASPPRFDLGRNEVNQDIAGNYTSPNVTNYGLRPDGVTGEYKTGDVFNTGGLSGKDYRFDGKQFVPFNETAMLGGDSNVLGIGSVIGAGLAIPSLIKSAAEKGNELRQNIERRLNPEENQQSSLTTPTFGLTASTSPMAIRTYGTGGITEDASSASGYSRDGKPLTKTEAMTTFGIGGLNLNNIGGTDRAVTSETSEQRADNYKSTLNPNSFKGLSDGETFGSGPVASGEDYARGLNVSPYGSVENTMRSVVGKIPGINMLPGVNTRLLTDKEIADKRISAQNQLAYRNEMAKIRGGASGGGNRLPVTPTVIEEILPEALPVPSASTTPTTQTGVDPNRLLQIQQQAYAQAYNPMLIGGFNPQFRFGAATPTIDYSTYFNY